MRILVVGGGGREHAIVWALARSAGKHEIFCAPGNAGIAEIAECVQIAATDIENLYKFARNEKIDYTVVGCDDPLALGIADTFAAGGLRVFGPCKNAAKLEWSKVYAKKFMKKYKIPSAEYETFSDFSSALDYCRRVKLPVAVKADGLAVGKGVYICNSIREAEQALTEIMLDKKFGEAGGSVVIEEFMEGVETTLMAFCDGKTLVPMVSAQDHKKAFDRGIGPNTGGMGVIAPSPVYSKEIHSFCMENIYKPTLDGLIAEGIDYKGVIYFELMVSKTSARVLEYNARFGDPEAQAVLPLLETNLLTVCEAVTDGRLSDIEIKWKNSASACVIIASGGYPGDYVKGFPISGTENIAADEAVLFHAGTKRENGRLVTNGGRVLGVTSLGRDISGAVERAYLAAGKIQFKDMHMRRDIGRLLPEAKALRQD